jgi:alpha-beta hydrolase superfamily lysophospholipase
MTPAHLSTRDGLKLFVKHWPLNADTPPTGIALLVHGLGEHLGRYEEVAQQLNQAGWAVMGYDQRGHGQSAGPRGRLNQSDDLLHDLSAMVDAARAAYPDLRLALIGHSMGGLVVSRFVAGLTQPFASTPWQRTVELCVLSSPALDLGLSPAQKFLLNTVGKWLPNVAVNNGLNAKDVCSDPAVVKNYQNDPLVHDRISGRFTWFMWDAIEHVHARAPAWSVPTLLLYAGADKLVPPAGSQRFAQATPKSLVQSKAYAHMAHEIFLEPDRAMVFKDLLAWLEQH